MDNHTAYAAEAAWNHQQSRIKELEKVEEKAKALVRYARAEKPDAMMAVITELGFLFPPEDNDNGL